MSILQFALGIVFPGVQVTDIVAAAIQNQVHMIDKESYDPAKDYAAINATYAPYINGSRIYLLFVFPNRFSILADTDEKLQTALDKIRAMQQ